MTAAAWVCLLAPLAGALLITLAGTQISRRTAGVLSTLSVFVGFGGAVWAFVEMVSRDASDRSEITTAWTWLETGRFQAGLELLVDPLSVVMMLVVSGVGGLIVLYSIGYMDGDDEERRYFAYMAFFVFSMLLLVEGGNLLMLLVGWGLVGLASYLLIGFWHERAEAVAAAKKAFIMNAFGDATMAMAFFLLIQQTGTLSFAPVFEAAEGGRLSNDVVTLVALGLLGGAVAKSAQIPLHTWLPDAMEGPTPVSALIHAATMVTAGVYLIARTHTLFVLAPTAADIAAFTGLATLLIAGSIALVMTDLKRAIAYSTMSQIGYMVVGVSIGAYSAGMFHLMTHAFFKALLFMAAGSIIAAMANEQNIDKMSGFGRAMRFTSITMLCGGLALAAFPGTSGFFSKDEILAYATARGGMYLIFTVLGYFGALLTAVYTFRLIFRVLPGRPCPEAQELIETGHVHHAHPFNPATGEEEDTGVGFPGAEHHIAEQSLPMRIAMGVLAFGALFAGLVQVPGVDDVVTKFLDPVFADSPLAAIHPSVAASWVGLAIGAAISLAGIGIAYFLYVARPEAPAALQKRFGALHTFLYNKWYFDEAIDFLVVRPALAIGRFADRTFERLVVDGLVSGTEDVVGAGGRIVRVVQSGFVRGYALLLIAGFAGLALYFLLSSS